MNLKTITEATTTVAGQGLLSIASFITTIILGRSLSPDDYAIFVLGSSLILILQGSHRSLLTIPYTVSSRKFNDIKRAIYSGDTIIHTLLYCLLIGLFIIIFRLTINPASKIWSQQTLVIIFFIWLATFIFRQHLRACLLAELHITKIFLADLISSALQICGLLWFQYQNKLQLKTAGSVLIAASLLPSLYMQYNLRELITWKSKQLWKSFLTSWKTGKWYLGNLGLYSLASQSIPWLLLLFSTKQSIAAFGICMSCAAILSPMLRGINSYLLPKMAYDLHQDRGQSMTKNILISSVTISIPYLFFLILSLFYGDLIITFLFNNIYSSYGLILTLAIAKSLIESISTPVTIALQSLESPRLITLSQAFAVIVMIILGLPLIYLHGLTGALIATILSSLLSLSIKVYFYKNEINKII